MIDPFGQIRDHEIPDAIRFALRIGWRPTESGPPIWIGFIDSENLKARFVVRNPKDPPYWRDPARIGKTSDYQAIGIGAGFRRTPPTPVSADPNWPPDGYAIQTDGPTPVNISIPSDKLLPYSQ